MVICSVMPYKERIILFTLAAVQFTHIVDFMIVMPLGPVIMRLFEINPRQFGVIVGSYAIAAGAFGFLGAFFIDRFDRRKALLFSYICFIVCTICCAFATGFYSLLILRMITGAFGGIIITLLLAIVADLYPYERRASAIGKIMTAFSLAAFAGVPIGLYLSNIFSWQAPFLFLGGITLITAVMIYKFVPSLTGHILVKTEKWKEILKVKDVMLDRNHLKAFAVMILLMMGQFTVIPFMSAFMVANVDFSESDITYIYLIGGGASIITMPLIGKFTDRYGKLRVFTILIFISTISIYLLTNLENENMFLSLLITGLFFVVIGGRTIPATTMITAASFSDHRGSFMSLNTAVRQFSVGFAAYLGGNMLMKSETGEFLNYDIVGWIAIVASLLALFIARSLKVRS